MTRVRPIASRFWLVLAVIVLALAPLARAQSNARYHKTDTVIEVLPGTTMFALVREHYPERKNTWLGVAADLAEVNPQAFRNGDPGSLIVGRQITLIEYGPPRAARPAAPALVRPAPAVTPSAPARGDREDAPTPAPQTPARHALIRIGQVGSSDGNAQAIDINNGQRQLAPGGDVFRGDVVVTRAGARVSLRMIDQARFDLRPDSRLVFENYAYDETADGGRSIVTLLRGGFRTISGLLAQRDPKAVTINSPVATVGVHGTDLGLRLCARGACRLAGDDKALPGGLYAGVLDGAAQLTNNKGDLAIGRGDFYRVGSPDAEPQPAPEAASLLFSRDELAALDIESDKPLTFWAWLKQRFF